MNGEFDFNAVPEKLFVDAVNMRIINGMLHLAIQSGESVECYVIHLPLAKLTGKAILRQVEEIEQKNNMKFDDRLPDEPMLSPWTSEDTKGEDDQKA